MCGGRWEGSFEVLVLSFELVRVLAGKGVLGGFLGLRSTSTLRQAHFDPSTMLRTCKLSANRTDRLSMVGSGLVLTGWGLDGNLGFEVGNCDLKIAAKS